MADLKISQFVDGGAVQPTDQIATNRAGVNTRVTVGTAAALDAGAGIGDVVTVIDVSGIPGLPTLDGSNLINISTLGTVTTGTWEGDVIDIPYGGTNASTAAGARANLGFASTTTDNAVSRYDGTTGQTQNSGVIIDDNNIITGIAAATIAANSASSALTITQDGAGNILTINDVTGDASPTIWDANGRFLFGYNTAFATQNYLGSSLTPQMQIIGAGLTNSSIGCYAYAASSAQIGTLVFSKSANATIGSHTAVTNTTYLGGVQFNGSDGTNFIPAVTVMGRVDGTVTTAGMPGKIEFSTTQAAAAVPTLGMTLDAVQDLTVVGNIKSSTAGKTLYIKQGTGGMFGDVTLVSGVGTVTITGLATTDRAFINKTVHGGTSSAGYKAICTANTLTITCISTAGATITTDTSTFSYFIVRPA